MFIATLRQKDGGEDGDQETKLAVGTTPVGQRAAPAGVLTLKPYMHKGCTRGA